MKSSNIWLADFETEALPYYEKYGHTKTWLTYIENLNSDQNELGITINDFYNFIVKQLHKQKVTQFVYFHNLSFDGTFILYYLNSIGVEYETVINNMKRIYEIKVFPTKANRHISFRCTYLIFPVAVASLPGSTKSDIDYERIRNYKTIKDATDQEIYYIKQDVQTVKRNLQALVKNEGVKLSGFFKTISYLSYNDLKQTTDKALRKKNRNWRWYFPDITLDMDEYMRPAYRGGWTFLNPKFKGLTIDDPVGSWDRVSSYPSAMVHDWLPAGKPKIQKSKPKDRLYIVRLRVAYAKIKDGLHPFINPNKTLRYLNDIYPNELKEVVIALTSVDMEMYDKYYESQHDVIDYCVFPRKVKGIFNDYIMKQFNTKNETKITKKTASKESEAYHDATFNNFWSKLKLNSPYGKFGSNPLMHSAVPVFVDGMLEWEETETQKEINKFYLPLACFITAYGRKALIDQVQANADRFIYSDTDSIHLLGTDTPESLKPFIGSDLNQWEYEGTSTKSRFLKPKQYLKLKDGEIKRTIASLNKSEHDRISFDNFLPGIEIPNGKKIAKNVKGGRIIAPLVFTFT